VRYAKYAKQTLQNKKRPKYTHSKETFKMDTTTIAIILLTIVNAAAYLKKRNQEAKSEN